MKKLKRHLLLLGLLLSATLACSFQLTNPTPAPGAVQTSVAQTMAVLFPAATLTAPAVPLATLPSAEPTLTPVPTLSPTSFVLFTVTSSVPNISVTVDTNCRVGPGKIYDRVGFLLVGETAEVIARDPSGSFFYIRNPENSNGFCWVTGEYAVLSGNVSILPIYTPPPTPTPAPAFEASFESLEQCGSNWWTNFLLENTGSLTFESVSLSVKDLVTGVTLTTESNEFLELGGCSESHAIDDLDPAKSQQVSSPAFGVNPDGHKMRATITVCTEDDLDGTCISLTLNFKP